MLNIKSSSVEQDLSAVELSRQNAICRLIQYEESFVHTVEFGAQKHRHALRQCVGNNKTFSSICSLVFQHVEQVSYTVIKLDSSICNDKYEISVTHKTEQQIYHK